jgi:hypothetical protein
VGLGVGNYGGDFNSIPIRCSLLGTRCSDAVVDQLNSINKVTDDRKCGLRVQLSDGAFGLYAQGPGFFPQHHTTKIKTKRRQKDRKEERKKGRKKGREGGREGERERRKKGREGGREGRKGGRKEGRKEVRSKNNLQVCLNSRKEAKMIKLGMKALEN